MARAIAFLSLGRGAPVMEFSTWPCDWEISLMSLHGHVEDSVTVAPQWEKGIGPGVMASRSPPSVRNARSSAFN